MGICVEWQRIPLGPIPWIDGFPQATRDMPLQKSEEEMRLQKNLYFELLMYGAICNMARYINSKKCMYFYSE